MKNTAYADATHEGNSALYHTGEKCRTDGCTEPAGTWWSPYWCFKHNVERIDRVTATLDSLVQRSLLHRMVNEATAPLRSYCERLIEERDRAAAIAWKPIDGQKIKDRDVLLTRGAGWIRHVGRWHDQRPQRYSPQFSHPAGWYKNDGIRIGDDMNFYAEIPAAPTEPHA